MLIASWAGTGFTKGLKSKICLKSKIKVLNVKNLTKFILRQNGIHKRSKTKFFINFDFTLRPLQGRLKAILKYSYPCVYNLPFVMPTKNIHWGSILPIKVIYVEFSRNLHRSIPINFHMLPHCAKNIVIKMADLQLNTKITIFLFFTITIYYFYIILQKA